MGDRLSPAVATALPRVLDAVVEVIASRGPEHRADE